MRKNLGPISIKISVEVLLKLGAKKSYSWITRSFDILDLKFRF